MFATIPIILFVINMLMPAIGFASAPSIAYFSSYFHHVSAQKFEDYVKGVGNINSVDNDGKTLLHIAFEKKYPFKIVMALLNAGADIHIRDTDGETPLFYACENQKEKGIAANIQVSDAGKLFFCFIIKNIRSN
ncbi:MAG: ankyrin repeat domain-containing protein [Candidatus Paracaedibacteraceae bacterium]|nr:ankyrin repeat domain-containing protein [Candidatus Paracaedibacteraceae bacterium]